MPAPTATLFEVAPSATQYHLMPHRGDRAVGPHRRGSTSRRQCQLSYHFDDDEAVEDCRELLCQQAPMESHLRNDAFGHYRRLATPGAS